MYVLALLSERGTPKEDTSTPAQVVLLSVDRSPPRPGRARPKMAEKVADRLGNKLDGLSPDDWAARQACCCLLCCCRHDARPRPESLLLLRARGVACRRRKTRRHLSGGCVDSAPIGHHGSRADGFLCRRLLSAALCHAGGG